MVTYTPEALEACAKLTERYITDRHLPDKAIDALDEVGSRVHLTNIHVPQEIIDIEAQIETTKEQKNQAIKSQQYEEAARLRDEERKIQDQLDESKKRWEEDSKAKRVVVTEEHVAEVVSMMCGIPVTRIAQTEMGKLATMAQELTGKVIGQDEAVEKVVKAIQRNRAGLKDPNKPIGSFVFLGPTGVGKTQLAKVLAKYLFDTEDALIRIDMSEYMEKFSISRLVGAPPGYVGYEEGGQLTEKVRRKPYSIVLLDEIEKAHPDVFNLLLQALDDGHMTDGLGRKIDFKNTILIMTSNIGARQLADFGSGVGFGTKAREEARDENAKSVIQNALRKAFSPEFLNRIDDMIIFHSLTRENIHKIIDLELSKLFARIQDLGYSASMSEKAKDFIVDKGYDEKFGARPLKRAIQKYIEDPLAEEIVKNNLSEGDTIVLDIEDGAAILSLTIAKTPKKSTKK
jgi:ATP-dependent Clp protease ATP-binding subunit ClpC